MPEKIDRDRRQLLGNAAASIAAAQFGTTALASERAGKMKMVRLPTLKPGTDTSFASLKQVDAYLRTLAQSCEGARNRREPRRCGVRAGGRADLRLRSGPLPRSDVTVRRNVLRRIQRQRSSISGARHDPTQSLYSWRGGALRKIPS